MGIDLSTLNPPQREAVLATEGPVLVLAGAGSGKTRVITFRIAHLMEKGVSSTNILAVTFTNKAATEMRERVEHLVDKRRASGLTVSTFHSFGLNILKRELHRLGYPRKFAILDASDQASLVKRCLKEVNDADRKFDVRRVISLISRAKMSGGNLKSLAGGDPEYDAIAREVYERYQRALFNMACVDFDDLIMLPAKIWRQFPQVLEEHQWQYRYLLVDEYQDTNSSQFELLQLLAGERQNLCAVGDDDQSIYGWRGAEVEHILRFEKQFRGVREIRLEQNYRSTGHILSAANAVIAKNATRKHKRLWTDQGDGDPISVVASPTEEDEAKFVADEILRIHYETKRKLTDFAILYRTNTQARPLEEALQGAGLRYDTHGGLKFFDRKEVKDVIAYLRTCHNVQDDVSVARIANTPNRGIGDTTMERLHARARSQGLHLFSVMKRAREFPELNEQQAESVSRFAELIVRYQLLIETDGWSKAARELCREVDMWGECKKHVDSANAAARKVENLESLLHGIERFEERNKGEGVAGYLARLSLDSRDEEPGEDTGDAVTLMTLHSAKGLEWPYVFLCGVEEDLLPHSGMQGEVANPDEERRLAYVGITRAREKLFLTRAQSRFKNGQARPRTPSRFLGDIPDAHLEAVDVAQPRTATAVKQMEKGRDFFARMRAMLGDDAPAEEPSAPKPPGRTAQ
jgi:DNA helicase-2/ATP-dependent DNA helicase PcrA